MDVQQLRSWIFEVFDPLTEDRTYIVLDGHDGTLIDLPPFDRRALLRVLGTCTPKLVFFTHADRARDAERWRAELPGVVFAIHEADAAAVPGGVDRAMKDGERLNREAEVIHIGAHSPGACAVLVHRTGGALFPGDAVIGTVDGRLALPEASYAPADKVRAGIEKLRAHEFSSVLSSHGLPVWNAGKDRYLALLEELPRPVKRFGHMVDAPWDLQYRGHLQDQMVQNPITPKDETIEPAAAHGPSTLVPAWERKPPPEVKWPEATPSSPQAGAAPPQDGKRFSLAGESATRLPPRELRRVETLPFVEPETTRYRRFSPDELLRVPAVDFFWDSLDVSSDGSEVVFAWNRTGNYEIYRAPVAGDAIYQLTATSDRSVQPRFSPDGRYIAFLRDSGGDERFDIWLTDRDGAHERRLTTTKAMHTSIAWSPDGSRIAYLSNEGGGLGLWTISVESGAARAVVPRVRHAALDVIAPSWSRDGRFIAYHSASDDDPRNVELYVVGVEGGTPQLIPTHPGASARAVLPQWGPRDDWLAFTMDLRGRGEIALVPMRDGRAAGAVRYLRDAHFDDFGPVWAPDGRAVLYHRSIDSSVSVRRAFVVSLDDEPVLDAPGVHADVRVGPDFSVVFTFTGPTSPADVYVKGPTDIEPRPLTRSLPPEIDAAVLVYPRHVRYPGADGMPIPALLFLPQPEAGAGEHGRPPAIVYPHGGPMAQHFTWWDPAVQWFANNGYVVLAPNVRGSTGYGRAFREANLGDWGGKDLDDVVKGADWLESEGIADRQRIGIYGGSYGGYLTLMALTRAPERWAAGCSVVGVVSLETMYRTTREDLREMMEALLGSPERDPELFRDRSPLTHVDRIEAPVLILQGKNDPRVPLAEAQQLVDALRREGKAFSYYVYEDEGHGFRRLENRKDALVRALEFFDEHVKGRLGAPVA